MSSDWQGVSLNQICLLIKRGISPKYSENEGILVINQRCIRDQRISLIEARKNNLKLREVAQEKYIQPGDVLINSTGVGTLGRVAQVKKITEPTTVDSHVTIARPNPECVNLDYFGWAVRAQESFIESLGEGSTGQTELSRIRLGNIRLQLPSFKEQAAIANVLTALDDKIELNRQMCKTLEVIASTLFKSWFIDFDPVKAKAASRKPEGMSPEIAELFPDRFVESVHGILPFGWHLQPLEELTDISIGRTPPRKEAEWFSLSSTDNKWISIKDLGDATVFISKTSEFLTSDAIKKFRIPIIPPKTVVISFKLTVGRIAITSEEMLSNEAIAHCSNPKIPVEFLYLSLKKYNFDLLGNTSSIGIAVNSKSIKSIKILVPGIELINYIKPYFQDVFDKIHHIVKENHILLEIRNLLLPKLISGSVKLKDIQDICKDV